MNANAIPPRENIFDRARESGVADRIVRTLETRLQRKRQRRKRTVNGLAAIAVLGLGLLWAVPYLANTETVSIPAAERRSLALADGSRAELNARTEIFTDFRYGRRVVRLVKGEGFFSVRSDPSNPFLVELPQGTIKVIGTQFNVRITAAGTAEVTLMEGAVELDSPAGSTALVPGQLATLHDAAPSVKNLSAQDIDRVLAWRRGRIVLDGMPLADVCARFAEFHGCTIAVDPSAPTIHLGGTFSLEDLPQFLEALRATKAVNVLSNGSTHRVLGR